MKQLATARSFRGAPIRNSATTISQCRSMDQLLQEGSKQNEKIQLEITLNNNGRNSYSVSRCHIIKFTGYRRRVKLRDSIRLCISPFYSIGAVKYKFTLIVKFNMDSISILVHVIRGEYDYHLTWPFVGSITVTLLSQLENKNHYVQQRDMVFL